MKIQHSENLYTFQNAKYYVRYLKTMAKTLQKSLGVT